MDPDRSTSRPVSSRLPRTRGDGPVGSWSNRDATAASPHTRGWTRIARRRGIRKFGFPAHAGMDPVVTPAQSCTFGLPRTRGDGPAFAGGGGFLGGASPHTRGWTRVRRWWRLPRRGFPAHAGMDPVPAGSRGAAARLPRTRGDGPVQLEVFPGAVAASPHTRGWTPAKPSRAMPGPGFPAHAGMDRLHAVRRHFAQRLPRTRGDGPPRGLPLAGSTTASPHTRGWTCCDCGSRLWRWGFPAHAGMDRSSATGRVAYQGLPRTRGDGPPMSVSLYFHVAASPHTRGWTLSRTRPNRSRLGLPRTRGDGPLIVAFWNASAQASPHTRGWTLRNPIEREIALGFPAHAGMDRSRLWAVAINSRLPRTRGDGPRPAQIIPVVGRASPHTRGWTRHRPESRGSGPGFPAHAGMDPVHQADATPPARLPRTRGDGPSPTFAAGLACRGFPAHAGMDPFRRSPSIWMIGLPRTRGDGPPSVTPGRTASRASPHTRGWTRVQHQIPDPTPGFPAHAGMDPDEAFGCDFARRLPRTRGDGPASNSSPPPSRTASPHTRGWTPVSHSGGVAVAGFPAHADSQTIHPAQRRDVFRVAIMLSKIVCLPESDWIRT